VTKTVPITPALLIRNASFWPPPAKGFDALLVRDGKIAWIGPGADAPPADRIVDAGWRTVMPGLTDAHIHLYAMAQNALSLDLSPAKVSSSRQGLALLVERVRALSGRADWLVATGYDEQRLSDWRMLDRNDLDEVSRDRPVVVRRFCGHVAMANSIALGLVDEGGSDGILKGPAAARLFAIIPKPDLETSANSLRQCADRMLKYGVTAATEAAVGFTDGFDEEWRVWNRLRRDDRFPLRMAFMLRLDAADAANRGIVPGGIDIDWQVRALKFFADGITGQHTAALNQPYADKPGFCGELMRSPEELERAFLECSSDGWQIASHAIGDRAIDVVVNAMVKALAAVPGQRPRVEHVARPTALALSRMSEHGIVAVPQYGFVRTIGDGFAPRLGEERAQQAYPARTFLRCGIALAGSSDAPSGAESPFIGIATAMSRRTLSGKILNEAEALTVDEALAMYTTGGAESSFQTTLRGSLDPGMAADIAVLDRDVTGCDPDQLMQTMSAMTIVRGEVLHTA
jgi:predicted amidohydrolase YtcJ